MIRTRFVAMLLALAATFSLSLVASAELPIRKPNPYNAADRTVDVFEAMKAGEIDVKFIPKDEKEAMLLVQNKTDKPLNVKLPEAFAGVPVLAQIGGGLGGGGLGAGGGGQGVGGGMGGGMGGMGGGLGGGVLNIDPGFVGKAKVVSVCLEHGKPDPTPKMKYTIAPLTAVSDKPETAELCKMLARGEIDQASAQAAAWHIEDGLTWEQLLVKEKVHLSNGYVEMYFNRGNIALAMKATQAAGERAKSQPVASPGEASQGAE